MENSNNKPLTSRQIKAQKTKKKLFKTAIKLFAEKGFNNVSMEDIAIQAGTSKGSFYNHFKSKDYVIIEQFMQIDEHYVKAIKKISKYKTAKEKLLAFAKEQQLFAQNELGIDILRVVYSSQLNNDTEKIIVDEKRILYKILYEIVEEGQKSGEFRNDISAKNLTRMIARCMRAVFYDWCVENGSFDMLEDGQWFFSTLVIKGILST